MWGATTRTKGGSNGKDGAKVIAKWMCWGFGASFLISSIKGESGSTLNKKYANALEFPNDEILQFCNINGQELRQDTLNWETGR